MPREGQALGLPFLPPRALLGVPGCVRACLHTCTYLQTPRVSSTRPAAGAPADRVLVYTRPALGCAEDSGAGGASPRSLALLTLIVVGSCPPRTTRSRALPGVGTCADLQAAPPGLCSLGTSVSQSCLGDSWVIPAQQRSLSILKFSPWWLNSTAEAGLRPAFQNRLISRRAAGGAASEVTPGTAEVQGLLGGCAAPWTSGRPARGQ